MTLLARCRGSASFNLLSFIHRTLCFGRNDMGIVGRHVGWLFGAFTMFGVAMIACSGTDGGSADFGSGAGAHKGGSGGSSGKGGAGGSGGSNAIDGGEDVIVFDTGFTGDREIDPDSSCAELTLQAEAVPLDMYFMVDVSGSMSGSNITALKNGLTNFFNDAQSAGLGAAAQRFPIAKYNDPYDETCDQNAYAKPAVPWAQLPNAPLVSWINSLNASGYTPTIPALNGSVQACHDRLTTMPTHKCAVVLVTDGMPEGGARPRVRQRRHRWDKWRRKHGLTGSRCLRSVSPD